MNVQKLTDIQRKDLGVCKHNTDEKVCFKCHPRACDKCKKCRASVIWTGDGGILAWTHGWTSNYCKCCAAKEQLAYAQNLAKGIAKLKREVKKTCRPASKALQAEAVRKNTHHYITLRCEKCGEEVGSSYRDGEQDPGERSKFCWRELNPPTTPPTGPRMISKNQVCGGKMVVVKHREEVR